MPSIRHFLQITALVGSCQIGLCHADLAVIVAAKSAIGPMTKHQVIALFMGTAKPVPGAPVVFTILESHGPVREAFLGHVLEKSDAEARAIWSKQTFAGAGNGPREVSDPDEAKRVVATNPNVVGVIDKSAVDNSVKVIYLHNTH